MDATELAAFDRARYMNLATFRRSGVAVRTPVWFAVDGGRIYLFSEAAAGKMKRLRNDHRVQFAACDIRGGVRGEWHDGSGRRVDDDATVERAYAALLRKYGWQMRIANAASRLTGRIGGRSVVEVDPSGP